MLPHWKIICNPKAGKGKGKDDWPEIAQLLSECQIKYHHSFSHHKEHAIALARQAYEKGYRHFIIVGGDGSFHEVVNGVAQAHDKALEQTEFALIPVGKGNDWARTTHIPRNYTAAVKVIQEHNIGQQDIGFGTFTSRDGKEEGRYFINMFGLGFDAFVARSVGERFEQGSKLSTFSYTWQLIKSLFKYNSVPATVRLNDVEMRINLYTLAVGIGKYNGGGMKQCPDAEINDGLFDVMVAEHVTRMTVITNIFRIFNGKFTRRKEVSTYRTSEVTIQADNLLTEADGEILGKAPTEIKVTGKKLNILLPSQ